MSIPTPKEAIDSIIEWTACDNMPSDPAARLQYYERRMMSIRNTARTVQHATEIEFPGALERNGMKGALSMAPEHLEVLVGLHKALSRMIDRHNPDSIEAEWLSHSNEVIRKITGQDVEVEVPAPFSVR
ncbi:hypothetical protein [Devosia sp.]|uniref:hypothetical protein n=1 Tax=Devosia sp. TaxID=1871048 RepID=UPI0027329C87|nr:hypothetical protein [Devosia sp.]MDP2782255.1 hypothetical protein [Devosia sp.]